jgi:hypothetical protein
MTTEHLLHLDLRARTENRQEGVAKIGVIVKQYLEDHIRAHTQSPHTMDHATCADLNIRLCEAEKKTVEFTARLKEHEAERDLANRRISDLESLLKKSERRAKIACSLLDTFKASVTICEDKQKKLANEFTRMTQKCSKTTSQVREYESWIKEQINTFRFRQHFVDNYKRDNPLQVWAKMPLHSRLGVLIGSMSKYAVSLGNTTLNMCLWSQKVIRADVDVEAEFRATQDKKRPEERGKWGTHTNHLWFCLRMFASKMLEAEKLKEQQEAAKCEKDLFIESLQGIDGFIDDKMEAGRGMDAIEEKIKYLVKEDRCRRKFFDQMQAQTAEMQTRTQCFLSGLQEQIGLCAQYRAHALSNSQRDTLEQMVHDLRTESKQKLAVFLQGLAELETLASDLICQWQAEDRKSKARQGDIAKMRRRLHNYHIKYSELECRQSTNAKQHQCDERDVFLQCIVCFEGRGNWIWTPCNHIFLCQDCKHQQEKTANLKCPVCLVVL